MSELLKVYLTAEQVRQLWELLMSMPLDIVGLDALKRQVAGAQA